ARGLDLMSPDTPIAAYIDLAAVRQTPLDPILRTWLTAGQQEEERALTLRLLGAERIWVFAEPRQEHMEVVFVIEGSEVESLVELATGAGTLEYVGQHGVVSEYLFGSFQVAYRAPDTLLVAGSRGDGETT